MVKAVVSAHCPASGVNIYVVVAVLFIAGDQVPLIPFIEVVDKVFNVSPVQIDCIELKLGSIKLLTVIIIVALLAHCPDDGEKV